MLTHDRPDAGPARARPRTYVVIGCGGFIGSHFLDRILGDRQVQVHGIDVSSQKIERHLHNPRFDFHATYLDQARGLDLVDKLLPEADALINLAAICNPSHYNTCPVNVIYSNFIDVYRLIELCARHDKWLVHFSTSEVYGRTLSSYVDGEDYRDARLFELSEDSTPLVMGPVSRQRWSYAAAKQLLERFIYGLHHERGLPFTLVRPFNFFGPRMDFIPGRDGDGIPRVLACFMTALLDDKPMQLVDGGRARRTIISIHDAIDALMLMLQRPERAQNQIFNVGSREFEVTIAELARLMRRIYAEVTGDPAYLRHPIVDVPASQFYGPGYEDCDRRMPNLDKTAARLGWSAKRSLDDTLRETMAYYHGLYGTSGVGVESSASPAWETAVRP